MTPALRFPNAKLLIGALHRWAVRRSFNCALLIVSFAILANWDQAVAFSYTQAAAHIGERASVEGEITQVFTTRSGITFLDMGGLYPNNVFVGVIFPENASEFSDATALLGRSVSMSGTITLYKGKPQIVLRSSDQLKVAH